VVLKHGEIFLKGRNRRRFEDLLHHNLRLALGGVPGGAYVQPGHGVTVIGGADLEEIVRRAGRVMGLAAIMPAIAVPRAVADIEAAAVGLLRDALGHGASTFAVRARRRDKTFPIRSGELAARVGAAACARLPATVNLTRPDVHLHVEVGTRDTYLATEQLPGQGGLPVGASGRALVLLSGGYDSPVAAHRAMRRGLHCDFVHFSGAPYRWCASSTATSRPGDCARSPSVPRRRSSPSPGRAATRSWRSAG
jgi:thiamine biosynthesis protein ThiI